MCICSQFICVKVNHINITNTHFSGDFSIKRCSGVRKADGSGDNGRGLSEVLSGEELCSEVKDTPCLRISWTALSLGKIESVRDTEQIHWIWPWMCFRWEGLSHRSKRSVVSCLFSTSISVWSWDIFPRSWETSLAWLALYEPNTHKSSLRSFYTQNLLVHVPVEGVHRRDGTVDWISSSTMLR